MKVQSKAWTMIGLMSFVACVTWVPLRAVAGDGEEDKWTVFFPTFVWVPAISGNVTARGQTKDVDLDISDVADHAKGAVNLFIEARREKFGFYANPMYMDLYGKKKEESVKVTLEETWWVVEFGGFYQVVKLDEERPLTLDVYGGGRYYNLKTDITLNNKSTATKIKDDSTTELIDPIIGLRVQKRVTEKLILSLRGDVGGFDLAQGTTSTFSWSVRPIVGYDFTKYFMMFAGYNAMGVKESDNSGAKQHGVDLTMHGPIIGFNFDIFGWLKDRRSR